MNARDLAMITGNFGPPEQDENNKRKRKEPAPPIAEVKVARKRLVESTPVIHVSPLEQKVREDISNKKNTALSETSTYEDVLSYMLTKADTCNNTPMEICKKKK